ncbi:MAG: EscU/YscU/HrcU family type III secretion system export apparatus switch protein, partial [Planctomycetota bacterium]
MGPFRDDEGKTEKPTPDRIRQARDRGQTPISKEFTMAGSLLVAVLVLEYLGWWLMDALEGLLRWGLDVNPMRHFLEDGEVGGVVREFEHAMSILASPYVVLALFFFLATMLFGYVQIGFKIAKQALVFRPQKLNPVTNLGRIFAFRSVFKTIFSAAKLAVLVGVLYIVIYNRLDDLAMLYELESFEESVAVILDLALTVFFWIAIVVLVISIGDIIWQRYDHTKGLMMTKQEVEDERKRTDGDPFIKNRLRAARIKLMQQRMMEAVPKADVVITNPTHYSVALKYERGKQGAPEVVAKGLDDLALRIREVAKEHDVPLMED